MYVQHPTPLAGSKVEYGEPVHPTAGALIAVLINTYSLDPDVRHLAVSILTNAFPLHAAAAWKPAKFAHAAAVLFRHVRGRFHYIPDRDEYLFDVEDVINPANWNGDCDDASIVLGSLARAAGMPVEVLIVGNSAEPYHALITINGRWYDVTGVVTQWNRYRFRVWERYPVGDGNSV